MNCAQFDWLVVDIAAGRIDAGADVGMHLAHCADCRARLFAERRLTAGLRAVAGALRSASAPAAVEQRLLAHFALRSQVALPARWRRWSPGPVWRGANRWLAAGALTAAVTLLLSIVVSHAPATRTTAARLSPVSRQLAMSAPPQIATPFYPMYATGAGVSGVRGVVRVRVPRATLAVFGLPYNPRRARDPITADLVVDNVGVVTAVRFVQ